MDDATLQQATRDLARRLRAPARVAAVEAAPRRLSLLLEWAEPSTRQRLVLDVDPAHATLHLTPAGREPAVASTGGFGGGLPGLFLAAVEEAGEPRLLRFRFIPPPRAEATEPRILVAEWTGASGNLRLLDSDDTVLECGLPRGPRPGEPWRPPHRRDTASGASASRRSTDTGPADRAARRDVGVRPETGSPVSSGLQQGPVAGPEAPGTGFDPAAFHAELARSHMLALARAEADERRRLYQRSLQTETRRLVRLRDNLLRERVDPEFGPRLRRGAEAILGHLHEVKKGDTRFECADWVRDGEMLVVELDPARTPVQNAEAAFRRARRWDRGEPHRRRRLVAIDSAVARLSALEVKIRDAAAPPGEISFARQLDEALGIFRRARGTASDRAAGVAGGTRRGRAGAAEPGEAAVGGRERGGQPAGAAVRRGGPAGARGRSGGGSAGAGGGVTIPESPRERRDRKEGGGFHPRSYQTKDGWTVLVGRSNQENDYLTHRLAHPEDYWFHAHGVPGSHVVLRREGRKDNPSAKTVEEAAAIAAFFSKARHSSKAPVIYTLRKYVRKPRGAKAGLAVCQREKSIMVMPKDPGEGREPEWMEE